jgi:hypothetical protein
MLTEKDIKNFDCVQETEYIKELTKISDNEYYIKLKGIKSGYSYDYEDEFCVTVRKFKNYTPDITKKVKLIVEYEDCWINDNSYILLLLPGLYSKYGEYERLIQHCNNINPEFVHNREDLMQCYETVFEVEYINKIKKGDIMISNFYW